MELSIIYNFWFIILLEHTLSMCEKYYEQKFVVDNTTTYTVNGVLDCENLCLELADSCLAINVESTFVMLSQELHSQAVCSKNY